MSAVSSDARGRRREVTQCIAVIDRSWGTCDQAIELVQVQVVSGVGGGGDEPEWRHIIRQLDRLHKPVPPARLDGHGLEAARSSRLGSAEISDLHDDILEVLRRHKVLPPEQESESDGVEDELVKMLCERWGTPVVRQAVADAEQAERPLEVDLARNPRAEAGRVVRSFIDGLTPTDMEMVSDRVMARRILDTLDNHGVMLGAFRAGVRWMMSQDTAGVFEGVTRDDVRQGFEKYWLGR